MVGLLGYLVLLLLVVGVSKIINSDLCYRPSHRREQRSRACAPASSHSSDVVVNVEPQRSDVDAISISVVDVEPAATTITSTAAPQYKVTEEKDEGEAAAMCCDREDTSHAAADRDGMHAPPPQYEEHEVPPPYFPALDGEQ